MPHRIEVEIRVIDEETGRTVRSAMESGEDPNCDADVMLGFLLAPMIDWFTDNTSLQAVCGILGSIGEYRSYKAFRTIAAAYEAWNGECEFDDLITVTANKDKLPIPEGKGET